MSYQYTAIGDSLTTGFGALPGSGFVPVYRRMAEVRLRGFVAYTNLGVNGLTSTELERRVSRNSSFRQGIKEADILTISIGGNDLIQASKAAQAQPSNTSRILREALQDCKQNFSNVIDQVYRLKSGYGQPYIIRVVGLYNPYPRIGEATDWVQQFNRYASQYSNQVYSFANIYPDFVGRERELLFLDHLHPNGRGYRTIAEHLNALGYGRLG